MKGLANFRVAGVGAGILCLCGGGGGPQGIWGIEPESPDGRKVSFGLELDVDVLLLFDPVERSE